MYLIVQFFKIKYNEKSELIEKRQKEINECLIKNYNNKLIKKIHILYETIDDIIYMENELNISRNDEKIKIFGINKRLKYNHIFSYANTFLRNKICIYLHADMYLYKGFELLEKSFLNTEPNNYVFGLTAHNKNCNERIICKCRKYFIVNNNIHTSSIDGFVFKSPLKTEIIKQSDYYVNYHGAENKTIFNLKKLGYEVYCPNNVLIAIHNHNIKIFNNSHSYWIEGDGNLKPLSFYQQIHKKQKENKIPFKDRIITNGISFLDGSIKYIDNII